MPQSTSSILMAATMLVATSLPVFALEEIGQKMIDRPPDNYVAVQEVQEELQRRREAAGLDDDESLPVSSFTEQQRSSRSGAIQNVMRAPETGSLDIFAELEGEWSGSGRTYLDRFGKELDISCDMAIDERESDTKLSGKCGALFLKKAIGIDLSHPQNGRVIGEYHALEEGPTRLEGKRTGSDTLVLTMHWPKVVMGDRVASMELKRIGPDTLRQTVSDEVDGKERVTSDITFERQR